MNDLISRSALLKNKTRMTEYDESGCGVHVFVVKEEDVLDAPTVDAVVVVRCKNCRFSAPSYASPKLYRQCSLTIPWKQVAADFFCASGEKILKEVIP